MTIPTLETARLVLRAPAMGDWPRYRGLMISSRSEFMGGPYSETDAWGFFCNDVAQWLLFGHGALMADERETGACVGQVAICHGPLFPEKELGWYLYPEAEGKGYAYEAAIALRDWALRNLEISSLVSYVDADNHRSRNLAERLGAVLDTTAARPDPADLVYRHPQPPSA